MSRKQTGQIQTKSSNELLDKLCLIYIQLLGCSLIEKNVSQPVFATIKFYVG